VGGNNIEDWVFGVEVEVKVEAKPNETGSPPGP